MLPALIICLALVASTTSTRGVAIQIQGRNGVPVTPALRAYIEGKATKILGKLGQDVSHAKVILELVGPAEVQHNLHTHRPHAKVVTTLLSINGGPPVKATEASDSMHASVDMSLKTAALSLAKHHRKAKHVDRVKAFGDGSPTEAAALEAEVSSVEAEVVVPMIRFAQNRTTVIQMLGEKLLIMISGQAQAAEQSQPTIEKVPEVAASKRSFAGLKDKLVAMISGPGPQKEQGGSIGSVRAATPNTQSLRSRLVHFLRRKRMAIALVAAVVLLTYVNLGSL